MNSDGEGATCSVCNMTYTIEAIRKLFQESQKSNGSVSESSDMIKLNKLLDNYIDTRDWDSAQQTVNELLRINPDNQRIRSIHENLQDWKNYEFHPVLNFISYHRTNNGYKYSCYKGKVENVLMPTGIRSISEEFFVYCKIKTIQLPESLSGIGKSAFYSSSLTSLECNQNLKYIGKEAFSFCSDLNKVVFNSGLRTIEEGAFRHTQIKEITIPESVEKIGNEAFQYTPLEKVIISNDLLNSIDILSVFEGTPYLMSEHKDLVLQDRRKKKVCQHCGGSFKGVFKKICSHCNQPKDY
jgi:hypothetical protein